MYHRKALFFVTFCVDVLQAESGARGRDGAPAACLVAAAFKRAPEPVLPTTRPVWERRHKNDAVTPCSAQFLVIREC